MYLRFRRRLRILPGLNLNLGKRGASLSVGVRGAHVTYGMHGHRATVGVPGTGLSATEYHPYQSKTVSPLLRLATLAVLAFALYAAF